jgi:hypothetical protein
VALTAVLVYVACIAVMKFCFSYVVVLVVRLLACCFIS